MFCSVLIHKKNQIFIVLAAVCQNQKRVTSGETSFHHVASGQHRIFAVMATVFDFMGLEIERKVLVSLLNKNTDNKKYTCLILLDLKKVFDTVDHKILLAKLEKYGIKGNVHKLIKNYLTDRQQYVNTNSTTSDLNKVCCGVPQGSTLDPTLFSLYINDLPNISNFTVRLFADDTALIMQDENLSNLGKKVKSELINVELWLRKNKLSLNCDKPHTWLLAHVETLLKHLIYL